MAIATTTLIPLHVGKGKTILAALGRTTDYVKNPNKTNDGEWITAYECDPLTAAEEFQFSKRQYAMITGRDQGAHDVIAYHLRQSFKPGEINPATANRIGYELAMKLTHGRHAFVACTHVDKHHIHTHVVINSTSLDCTRKFRNFYRSSFVIRRISDQLCLENGLSVIEKPKPSPGKDYSHWLGGSKPQTNRQRLEALIDSVLPACKDFNSFVGKMQGAGCEVKQGKYLSFKPPDAERFTRCKSLGLDYSEDAILERISGKRIVPPRKIFAPAPAPRKPSLLIDIQSKMQQGYGVGYANWTHSFNLKEASQTLLYLRDVGIGSYDELAEKASAALSGFYALSHKIRAAEDRMAEITELQKQLTNYRRTLEVYRTYRDSNWKPKFYNEHSADIIIHQAAKKHFDALGLKKLPPMQSLKQEWAALAAEKKKLYGGYHEAKQKMKDLQTAKRNVDMFLGEPRQRQKDYSRDDR